MTFETFFAQSPRPALLQGPGIARRFSAFGANFFLLDGRTFRDPHKFLGAKMLGQEQEDWMFGNLEEKPAWLLNGSMFFGAYNNMESFEGPYHGDFQNFLSRLKSSGGLFCFGSGDVHFSEVSKIEREILGYETFELVSSSIHSYAIPGHERRLTNPRRVVATGVHNFVIFEGEFGDREVSGTASSYSADRLEFRESVGASLQK